MHSSIAFAIPTFGEARFLGATLHSIRDQSVPTQAIVCDGGSSFDYSSVAGDFLRVIALKNDPGMVAAWASAASAATSNLVGFLADDNCLTPGYAKAMSEFFQEYPQCQLVFGEQQIINQDGDIDAQSSTRMSVEYGRSALRRGVVDPATYGDLIRRNSIGLEACVVRKQLLDDLGPFDPRARGAFDILFLWKALISGRVIGYCPQAVMSFRQHDLQYSVRKAREHCDGALWAHNALLESMPSKLAVTKAIRASRARLRMRWIRTMLAQLMQKAS